MFRVRPLDSLFVDNLQNKELKRLPYSTCCDSSLAEYANKSEDVDVSTKTDDLGMFVDVGFCLFVGLQAPSNAVFAGSGRSYPDFKMYEDGISIIL